MEGLQRRLLIWLVDLLETLKQFAQEDACSINAEIVWIPRAYAEHAANTTWLGSSQRGQPRRSPAFRHRVLHGPLHIRVYTTVTCTQGYDLALHRSTIAARRC